MAKVRIQERAALRIDDIFRFTLERWGEDQAERYIVGLFDAFENIQTGGVSSRPVPAAFGINGFFFRYERHFVYWRRLDNGDIGIATILHERMHQIDRFKDEFGL